MATRYADIVAIQHFSRSKLITAATSLLLSLQKKEKKKTPPRRRTRRERPVKRTLNAFVIKDPARRRRRRLNRLLRGLAKRRLDSACFYASPKSASGYDVLFALTFTQISPRQGTSKGV